MCLILYEMGPVRLTLVPDATSVQGHSGCRKWGTETCGQQRTKTLLGSTGGLGGSHLLLVALAAEIGMVFAGSQTCYLSKWIAGCNHLILKITLLSTPQERT